MTDDAVRRPTAQRELLRRWVLWTTVGEVAGFTAPALAGVLTVQARPLSAWAALVLAGMVEGAALGWAQSRVLQPLLPQLNGGRFTALTSAAAMVAYAVGMAPSSLGDRLPEAPRWALVSSGVVGGVVLLASIGTAQWLELRRVLPRSSRWIGTTAMAWTLGLATFLAVATPLWREGQAAPVRVAIGVGAAFAMAVVVALVTGAALVRLVGRR